MEMNIWKIDWLPWHNPKNWIENLKSCGRHLKWSWQRVTRGYSDYDTWSLDSYLTNLIADSIDHLADTTHGYPGDKTPEGSSYENWVDWLHTNAELLRRSEEDYYYHNEYEEQMYPLYDKWTTEPAKDGMSRLVTNYTPEDEELSKKSLDREVELYNLRQRDLETALTNLMKRWYSLWD